MIALAIGLPPLLAKERKKKRSWRSLKETDMLDCLNESKKEGRSKSRGKELASAIRIFKYIIGTSIDLEAVLRSLVVGKSNRMASDKDLRNQAPALSVEEIENLERRILEINSSLECYYCDCLLFALFARYRWNDLAYLDSLEFDHREFETEIYSFIEGRTHIYKITVSEEKKALQMPLVAPMQGLLSKSWSLIWIESLEFFGLLPGDNKFGALCRPADRDQNLFKRSIINAEASDILRFFIQDPDASDHSSVEAKTSYNLKVILLIWASRFGIDENSRTLLGHHALPGDSLAYYSRDILARPLRKLDKMLADIRTRRFIPDTTSGWLMERKRGPVVKGASAEVEEHQMPWTEAAWYDQAADNIELASGYEPSPVCNNFQSHNSALNIDATTIAVHESKGHCDVDASSRTASPEPGSIFEEKDLVEDSPNQCVEGRVESPNYEVPQPEQQEVESEATSDSCSSSTSSDSESRVNEEEFNQS